MMTEEELQQQVWNLKARAMSMGLNFFPVEFDVISRKEMVEFGAYLLPSRYHHWTFGKYYGKLRKLQNLGVLEILEMVMNADPARAYLLDSNTDVENKMVIAHVYGHVDFFKNNHWFKKTNKNMISEAEYHEKRLHDMEFKHGKKAVEEFLDILISIQWHTDFYSQFGEQGGETLVLKKPETLELDDLREKVIGEWVMPEEYTLNNDLLMFLINSAGLEAWQQEVLGIIREEMLYFMPNALTKIMNEGWATYWQEKILKDYFDFADYDKFAIKHSEILATPGLNPYRLGYMMYKDIKKRWDQKEGKGAGIKKIFEIRSVYDDLQFIREFLSQEVCEDCGLFVFERPGRMTPAKMKSTDVEDIKKKLIGELINFGKPLIAVKEFKSPQDKDLHLFHRFDGRELNIDHATDVLKALFKLWNQPIHLETIIRDDRCIITFDGQNQSVEKI
jgi:stage V sporulation protein R